MARPTDEGQRYNTQQGSEWDNKEGRGRHINPFWTKDFNAHY